MIPQPFLQNATLDLFNVLSAVRPQNLQGLQTTSIDGKPLLNPVQFSLLQQQQYLLSQLQLQRKIKTFKEEQTNNASSCLSRKRSEQCDSGMGPEKKVKIESSTTDAVIQKEGCDVSTASTSSPISTETYPIRQELLGEISEISMDHAELDLDNQLVEQQEPSKVAKPKKMISKAVEKKLEKLKFKVKLQSNNNQVEKSLSRGEILKADPLLLLYFYERHLQFKSKDFDSKNLIKL